MRIFKSLSAAALLIVILALLIACEKQPETDTVTTVEPTPPIDPGRVDTAAEKLWSDGAAVLESAIAEAEQLQKAISDFLASPSAETLQAAQQQWHAAFLDYRGFYFFYFLGQTAPSTFTTLPELHFRIAANPIQPGYLDSFGPYLYSGLVHDIGMEINRENLVGQHGLTNSEDAALGLYALHFMLFGIDGQRPAADYAPAQKLSQTEINTGFKNTGELPNNRRRKLLQLQANILVEDLRSLNSGWHSSEPGSIQSAWQSLTAREKLDLVNRTLRQGLTQLIVDVVELKKLEEASASASISEGRSGKAASGAEQTTAQGEQNNTEETEAVEPEDEFSYTNYPAAEPKQFIARSIESLASALPVLKKEKRKQVQELLTAAHALLAAAPATESSQEQTDTAKKDTQAQKDDRTRVYENLKAAVDIFNAS